MGDSSGISGGLLMQTLLTNATPASFSQKMAPPTSSTLPKPLSSALHTQPLYYHPPSSIPGSTNETEQSSSWSHRYSPPTFMNSNLATVTVEHCYAKPQHWKSESTSLHQPTKLLFMKHPVRKRSSNPLAQHQYCKEVVDVECIEPDLEGLYDKDSAVELMEECEKHVENSKIYHTNDDWEESIIKSSWTPIQLKLFNEMATILNNDQLARLAHAGVHHEPIKRRIVVDKSVKRMRHAFSTICWDGRLTQWIHQVLLDHLSPPYLSAYLDILQTLKAKLPSFVDKMMFGPNATSRIGATSLESMFQLLQRPWDPFSSYLAHNKLCKLNSSPVIIIVPSAPSTTNTSQFKRQQKWTSLLSNLATVVAVHTNIGNNANRLTMINCADQMLTATRAKVQEVKAEFNDRAIILIGFNAGSALALQVAQVENVFCVVCMGFSVLTAEGKRGNPDDSLLDLQCPVLFVIGQCSNTSSQEDIEDLRERMRMENGLIVVGSADDYLRVNKKKKREEGITQSAVDRIVVENVGEFINGLFASPRVNQLHQTPAQASNEVSSGTNLKIERTRNMSNASSIESEPPSPTPKITRPVGRPPGSKSKNKLETKWATQVAQGIFPSSSSSSSTSPHLTQPISKPHSTSTPLLEQPKALPLSDTIHIKRASSLSQSFDSDSDSVIEILSDTSSEEDLAARQHMIGLNRSILTSGNVTQRIITTPNKVSMLPPPKNAPGIRVLENLSFNAGSSGKPVTKSSIDFSKFAFLSAGNATTPKNLSNMVLMPDGKIKTMTLRGSGAAPLVFPMVQQKKTVLQMPHAIKHGAARYITSKKQLLGRKLPYPLQKPLSATSYTTTNLPPPTNLTSQDIMDLPIIFADDNKMLTENSELQQSDVAVAVPEIAKPLQPPKLPVSNAVGKFVFVNRQQPVLQSLTSSGLKRPTLSVPVRTNSNPMKLTKIILSRGLNSSDSKSSPIPLSALSKLSPDVSIQRIKSVGDTSLSKTSEATDLENITATLIPKTEYAVSDTNDPELENTVAKLEKSLEVIKRNALAAMYANAEDDDDPDYIPPKNVKY